MIDEQEKYRQHYEGLRHRDNSIWLGMAFFFTSNGYIISKLLEGTNRCSKIFFLVLAILLNIFLLFFLSKQRTWQEWHRETVDEKYEPGGSRALVSLFWWTKVVVVSSLILYTFFIGFILGNYTPYQ